MRMWLSKLVFEWLQKLGLSCQCHVLGLESENLKLGMASYMLTKSHSISNQQEFRVTSQILTKLGEFVVPMGLIAHTNF